MDSVAGGKWGYGETHLTWDISTAMWWQVLEVACSTTRWDCFINKFKISYLSSSKGLTVACGATQLITNPWFMRTVSIMLIIPFFILTLMQHKTDLVLFSAQTAEFCLGLTVLLEFHLAQSRNFNPSCPACFSGLAAEWCQYVLHACLSSLWLLLSQWQLKCLKRLSQPCAFTSSPALTWSKGWFFTHSAHYHDHQHFSTIFPCLSFPTSRMGTGTPTYLTVGL